MATSAETTSNGASERKPAGIEFYGGYQVYSESGVDLTLLRENLKKSVTKRLEWNRRALVLVEALRSSTGGAAFQPIVASSSTRVGLSAIVRHLVDSEVRFVIVGGMAGIAHGSEETTQELAVCYARTRENLAALVAALTPFEPYLRGAPENFPFRFDVPTLQRGLNFALATSQGELNLIGEVPGIGAYEQVVRRSEPRTVFDLRVRVLTLEATIACMKGFNYRAACHQYLELEELKKLRDADQGRN